MNAESSPETLTHSTHGLKDIVVARYKARQRLIPGEPSGRLGLGLLGLALVGILSLQFGSLFLSVDNLLATLMSISSIAIAVTGMMLLLISGNVDLSIGSMYALVAVVVGEVAAHTHSMPLAVGVGLALGCALGTVNGLLVRALKLSPLIVTIATLAIYAGIALAITGGTTVFEFPSSFTVLGQGGIGRVQYPILVAGVIFAVGSFLLVRTRAGLRMYAIGGNAKSAERAGIPVARMTVAAFAINGTLIGVVAILTAARLGSADPSIGTNFEFDVLTAAILGGVAFTGGSGRPLGVLLGVALIGIVKTGVIFWGLQSYWQEIVQGSLLLAALTADQALIHLREWRGSRASKRAAMATKLDEDMGNAVEADAFLKPATFPGEPHGRTVTGKSDRGQPVLEARGLTKRYGGVVALRDVSVTVRAGEVVCVVGDNGAGKSTLIQILAGAVQPDDGSIAVSGSETALPSPGAARALGIETVYQDLALCGNLSVAHNLVLGDEPTRRMLGVMPVRDDAKARSIAKERLRALGTVVPDYDTSTDRLSGGQRQSVAIARAMRTGARTVILDEPTAALGVRQTENVMNLVRSVAAGGKGVLMITHDIETVLAVADSIVVLRLASVVHRGAVGDVDEVGLLQLMAGLGDGRSSLSSPEGRRNEVEHFDSGLELPNPSLGGGG